MTTQSVSLTDSLDRAKLRFVDVDGIRTRVYEDGAGEPLVLLHGGEFSSLYSLDAWSLNLPALAKRFHVFAIDKLGQGHTDNPKTPADYTFEALLDHTLGTLRALGIEQAHFVGHSRGGFLALRIAIEHPALVRSLVILDSNTSSPDTSGSGDFYSSLEHDWPAGAPLNREQVTREPFKQAFSRAQVTDDFVDRLYEIAQLPKSVEGRRQMKDAMDRTWLPSLERAREATFEYLAERSLPVRTLVIWGYNDKSAPLQQGSQLMDLLFKHTLDAEFHIVNGAGHYSYREQPAMFQRQVIAFCGG